jgi:hypothetical protein
MPDVPVQGAEQVRAAEVIGALCLATDLGMGFPFEHGLQSMSKRLRRPTMPACSRTPAAPLTPT